MYAGSGLNGLVTEINNCRNDVYAKMKLMLMKRQFFYSLLMKIKCIVGENHE